MTRSKWTIKSDAHRIYDSQNAVTAATDFMSCQVSHHRVTNKVARVVLTRRAQGEGATRRRRGRPPLASCALSATGDDDGGGHAQTPPAAR
jgi:hypothetical protein